MNRIRNCLAKAAVRALTALLWFFYATTPAEALVSGAMVATSPGPTSPNSLQLSITVTGFPGTYTAVAHPDAGSHLNFQFEPSTGLLTVTAMRISAASTLIDLGGIALPLLNDLVIRLDESDPLFPPQATVDAVSGAVSLTAPVLLSGTVAGFPISASQSIQVSANFLAVGAGRYHLTGSASFSFTSGAFTTTGSLAVDFQKFRNPVGDFNADGSADPTAWDPNTGTWLSSFTAGEQSLSVPFGQQGDTPLTGDFNSDGQSDFVIYRPGSTSQWLISLSPSYAGASLSVSLGSSTTNDKPFVCDFNGDGLADIGVTRPGFLGSATYVIRFSPTYSVGTEISRTFGLATDAKFFGDLNGDAMCDILVNRGGNQNYATYSPAWANSTSFSHGFGLPGDLPVHADFDGDGLLDLAVTRGAGAALAWYASFSSSAYSGTQLSAIAGTAGAQPAVDDYNGDGKADIADYTAGRFEITFSPSYVGTQRTEELGASTDIVVVRPTRADGLVGK